MMNVNQLLRDIDWALGLGDELAEQQRPIGKRHTYGAPRVREGYFAKAADDPDDDEPNAHARVKSDHHKELAELHAKIADQHHGMARHYKDGAKGAHKDASEDEDADIAAIKVLKAAGLDTEARLAVDALNKRAVRDCMQRPQLSDPSASAFNRVRGRTS